MWCARKSRFEGERNQRLRERKQRSDDVLCFDRSSNLPVNRRQKEIGKTSCVSRSTAEISLLPEFLLLFYNFIFLRAHFNLIVCLKINRHRVPKDLFKDVAGVWRHAE